MASGLTNCPRVLESINNRALTEQELKDLLQNYVASLEDTSLNVSDMIIYIPAPFGFATKHGMCALWAIEDGRNKAKPGRIVTDHINRVTGSGTEDTKAAVVLFPSSSDAEGFEHWLSRQNYNVALFGVRPQLFSRGSLVVSPEILECILQETDMDDIESSLEASSGVETSSEGGVLTLSGSPWQLDLASHQMRLKYNDQKREHEKTKEKPPDPGETKTYSLAGKFSPRTFRNMDQTEDKHSENPPKVSETYAFAPRASIRDRMKVFEKAENTNGSSFNSNSLRNNSTKSSKSETTVPKITTVTDPLVTEHHKTARSDIVSGASSSHDMTLPEPTSEPPSESSLDSSQELSLESILESSPEPIPVLTPESTSEPSPEQQCPICLNTCQDPVNIKCGHAYCSSCLEEHKKSEKYKPICPQCNGWYGEGTQPQDGKMVVERRSDVRLEGRNTGSIIIKYSFPDGHQEKNHPKPGQAYSGVKWEAYLPDDYEGNLVLPMLQKAFDWRLIFKMSDVGIKWNNIPHKTGTSGGPGKYSYPDHTYLLQLNQELAKHNIHRKGKDIIMKTIAFGDDTNTQN